MVRISDGFMQSFGGTFGVSVPMPIEVGACFNPAAIAPFFRKERGPIAYTIKNGKLILTEGKERLTVGCLPAEEMVTLDVLGTPTPCEFDMKYLKIAVDVINPTNERIWAQGVSFRNGMMESTNNALVVSAVSNLPDELSFNLPHDSCRALLRFKSTVVGVVKDQRAVKFVFADGSSLCSLVITEQMIDTSAFFRGGWKPIELTEDVSKIDCEYFSFVRGSVHYVNNTNEGVIESCVDPDIYVDISKDNLNTLLIVSKDIRLSDDGNRVQAFGEDCRVISCARRAS